jgi:hypothetical protein
MRMLDSLNDGTVLGDDHLVHRKPVEISQQHRDLTIGNAASALLDPQLRAIHQRTAQVEVGQRGLNRPPLLGLLERDDHLRETFGQRRHGTIHSASLHGSLDASELPPPTTIRSNGRVPGLTLASASRPLQVQGPVMSREKSVRWARGLVGMAALSGVAFESRRWLTVISQTSLGWRCRASLPARSPEGYKSSVTLE